MKVGIAVNNLANNQFNYLFLSQANDLVARRKMEIVGFYETIDQPMFPINFSTMQLAEGWAFDGILITNSINLAEKIQSFPSCKRKILYLWELEWLRKPTDYIYTRNILSNIELFTRNEDYANVLSNVWGLNSRIVENFNLEKICLHS